MWILSIPIIALIVKIQQLQYHFVSDFYYYGLYSFFAFSSMLVFYLTTMRNREKDDGYIIKEGRAGVVVSLALLSPLLISMLVPHTKHQYDTFIFLLAVAPLLVAMKIDKTIFRLCGKDEVKKEQYFHDEKKSVKSLLESGIFTIGILFAVYNFAWEWHEDKWQLLLLIAVALFVINMIAVMKSLHRMSDDEGKAALKQAGRKFWMAVFFASAMLLVAGLIIEPEIVNWIAGGALVLAFPAYTAIIFYTVHSNEKRHIETLEKQKEQDKVLNHLDQLVQPVNDEETEEVH